MVYADRSPDVSSESVSFQTGTAFCTETYRMRFLLFSCPDPDSRISAAGSENPESELSGLCRQDQEIRDQKIQNREIQGRRYPDLRSRISESDMECQSACLPGTRNAIPSGCSESGMPSRPSAMNPECQSARLLQTRNAIPSVCQEPGMPRLLVLRYPAYLLPSALNFVNIV